MGGGGGGAVEGGAVAGGVTGEGKENFAWWSPSNWAKYHPVVTVKFGHARSSPSEKEKDQLPSASASALVRDRLRANNY